MWNAHFCTAFFYIQLRIGAVGCCLFLSQCETAVIGNEVGECIAVFCGFRWMFGRRRCWAKVWAVWGVWQKGVVWSIGKIQRLCPNGLDDLKGIAWQKRDDICHVKTIAVRPNNLSKPSLKETKREYRPDYLDPACFECIGIWLDFYPYAQMEKSESDSKEPQWPASGSMGAIGG